MKPKPVTPDIANPSWAYILKQINDGKKVVVVDTNGIPLANLNPVYTENGLPIPDNEGLIELLENIATDMDDTN